MPQAQGVRNQPEHEVNFVGGSLKKLGIAEVAGGIVGFLYFTGYYINLIFIRNLGITHSELLRLEYVSIGFTFALITLGLVFLPFATFRLTYRVRRASGLFHLHIGAIGNSLNTTLFLAFPLFLAFFATKYEMGRIITPPVLGIERVSSAILVFVALTATGTILVPVFERGITRWASDPWCRRLYRLVVEPVRYGIFTASLYLMARILPSFGWVEKLASSSIYYLLVGVTLVVGLVAATLWIRQIRTVKGTWLVYGLIAFGLAALYYFAVTSYVQGVYIYIPENRGGRLPLTRPYVDVSPNDERLGTVFPDGSGRLRGPLYIIEETADTLFVADERMDHWLTEFVPVHAVRKELMPYMRFERITDGFPRATAPPAPASERQSAMSRLRDFLRTGYGIAFIRFWYSSHRTGIRGIRRHHPTESRCAFPLFAKRQAHPLAASADVCLGENFRWLRADIPNPERPGTGIRFIMSVPFDRRHLYFQ